MFHPLLEHRTCGLTLTLTIYQHVHPGMGREAADRFAALRTGLIPGTKSQAGIPGPPEALTEKHPGFLTCRNTVVRLCPRGDTLHTHTRLLWV